MKKEILLFLLASVRSSTSFAPSSSSSSSSRQTLLAAIQEDIYLAQAIPAEDVSAYDRLLEKLRDKNFNPFNPLDISVKTPPFPSLPNIPNINAKLSEVPIPKMNTMTGGYDIKNEVNELVKDISSNQLYTEVSRVIQSEVVNPYLNAVKALAKGLLVDEGITLFISIIGTFGLLSLITRTLTGDRWRYERRPTSPYESGSYDPAGAKLYFESKPFDVSVRQLEILLASLSFGFALLSDYFKGTLREPETEAMRGKQVTGLLADLGPTFIKVGQSLSIRSDLLRPAYLQALSKLQDEVPPFDSKVAVEIIEEELGKPVNAIFKSGISSTEKVIAAASLGQVYRARLVADDREVAVKVQRPDILDKVALDMHVLREAAPLIKKIVGLESDLVGIVDDWGNGFVDELNYLKEANNAQVFMESIKTTSLKDVVFAPPVVEELSTKKILVSEWVQGDRLDKSNANDLTVSCSIAMNTYLTMMLETGVLHCDPHPGNLFRTPDGRLCILDWGLVTTLDPDLQLTFIEHIAHLTSRDYAKVPQDLVKLGFIPKGYEQVAKESGVVDVLSEVYTQFAGGGGAAKIDVNAVIGKLTGLADEYGNIFRVPPYFAYIAKAFGVLEGIGLASNPDYAIVGECLPYVSQRLLTDTNPRTGEALKNFIFGAQGDRMDRVVDVDRIELLLDGFGSYSSSARSVDKIVDTTTLQVDERATRREDVFFGSSSSSSSSDNTAFQAQVQDKKKVNNNNVNVLTVGNIEYLSDQVIDLLLVRDGDGFPSSFANRTPLQKLAIEEISKIIGALSRQQWKTLRERSGILPTGRSLIGTIVDPLGLFQESPLTTTDPYDERIIDSTSRLLNLLQREVEKAMPEGASIQSMVTSQDSVQFLNSLSRKLWERRREIAVFGTGVAAQLIENSITRLDNAKGDRSAYRNSSRRIRGSGQQNFDKVFNNQIEMPDQVPIRKISSGSDSNTGESERLKRARGLINQATSSTTLPSINATLSV